MTAEGLWLSLAYSHEDGVSESKCGESGRSYTVKEFVQFLRHRALS